MKIGLNLPINSVSFGQISTLLLREIYKSKKIDPNLFLIGNQVDVSSQEDLSQDFLVWLQTKLQSALSEHKRNVPTFKLWHLNGSLESFSNEQTLFTFYELDNPTKEELNIVNNNKNVIVSSEYTKEVFNDFGCKNMKYIPLAFDKYNFKVINKKYFLDDRIVFNLCGKLEKRKNHEKVIKAWLKKFGNNKKYFLQCSIFNPFIKAEDQQRMIHQILEGKNYFNLSFLGYIAKNGMYNDYLNSSNIILGLSGGEGWGLPEFHSVALGKHAVIMDAHGYKGWANSNNSILVKAGERKEVYDNIFFQKGSIFNQGNIFDFNEDEFIAACEKAIEKVEKNKVNTEGLKLQEEFTSEKLLSNILEIVKP